MKRGVSKTLCAVLKKDSFPYLIFFDLLFAIMVIKLISCFFLRNVSGFIASTNNLLNIIFYFFVTVTEKPK